MVITQMLGLGKNKSLKHFDMLIKLLFLIFFRDNVYSIYCVFGLALAYRRVDDTTGRACKFILG